MLPGPTTCFGKFLTFQPMFLMSKSTGPIPASDQAMSSCLHLPLNCRQSLNQNQPEILHCRIISVWKHRFKSPSQRLHVLILAAGYLVQSLEAATHALQTLSSSSSALGEQSVASCQAVLRALNYLRKSIPKDGIGSIAVKHGSAVELQGHITQIMMMFPSITQVTVPAHPQSHWCSCFVALYLQCFQSEHPKVKVKMLDRIMHCMRSQNMHDLLLDGYSC